jgi:hypothetical protein
MIFVVVLSSPPLGAAWLGKAWRGTARHGMGIASVLFQRVLDQI